MGGTVSVESSRAGSEEMMDLVARELQDSSVDTDPFFTQHPDPDSMDTDEDGEEMDEDDGDEDGSDEVIPCHAYQIGRHAWILEESLPKRFLSFKTTVHSTQPSSDHAVVTW